MIISKAVEDKVLSCLLRNQEFASISVDFLKPHLFSMDIDKNISKIALDAFRKHNTLVTSHIFGYEVKKLLDTKIIKEEEIKAYSERFIELYKIDIKDSKYVLDDQLVPFVKDREWRRLMKEALEKHLQKGDFASLETRADFIKNIGEVKQVMPIETWSDEAIESRYQDRKRELDALDNGVQLKIPFGIPKLDNLFNGGMTKNEMIVFAAGPKIGKTFSMTGFAKSASEKGFNVAYFSFETSIKVIQSRLDADISNIETNLVTANAKRIRDEVGLNRPREGEIFFFKYANGVASAETVKQDVKRLEIDKGIKIDLVCVDYIDISKLPTTSKDHNINEKILWESYRRVGEELGVALLSATQISTKTGNNSIASISSVLGSSFKPATVDALIILSGTEKDLREGKIFVNTSTCRNVPKCVFSIKTAYKYGRFFECIDQNEIL